MTTVAEQNAANDALHALADHLEGAELPLAWAVEHAPDGTLDRAWARTWSPRSMLRLLALTDRWAAVRAAIACVNDCIEPSGYDASRSDGDALRCLELARTWLARGGGPLDARLQIPDVVGRTTHEPRRYRVAYAASCTAMLACWHPDDPAFEDLEPARLARLVADHLLYEHLASVAMADVIRWSAPCPDLQALLARKETR